MRAASAIVFASAVLAASATAASLDVEPTEPTTTSVLPSNNGISSNATSNDGKISIEGFHNCEGMKYADWNDFKYACAWDHGLLTDPYNLFFMRWDGSVVKECWCHKGLKTYDPWHPRWTYSSTPGIECYSRDGKTGWEVRSVFNPYHC